MTQSIFKVALVILLTETVLCGPTVFIRSSTGHGLGVPPELYQTLSIAVSTNGLDWQRLYGKPVLTNFSRDASIIRNGDEFVTVYTDAFTGASGTFGLARSTDLINWTATSVALTGPAMTNTPNNTWAPEWFVDGTNHYVVVRSSQTAGQNYGPPGLGYLQCFDPGSWTNWGPFTPIADLGWWENDAFILKKDDTYHLFTDRSGQIVHRRSNTGPFAGYNAPETISDGFTNTVVYSNAVSENLWYTAWEGPFVLPLEGDRFRLYFQGTASDRCFAIDSSDGMRSWDLATMTDVFYEGRKGYGHGSVMAIDTADALLLLAGLARRADQAITKVESIQANPNTYNLYTSADLTNSRAAGRAEVTGNPTNYGLYTTQMITDLNLGGVVIQKSGSNAMVNLQLQTTPDLSTSFIDHGQPVEIEFNLPGNKHFLRIRALGPQ
jgi:hypothetical protein